MTRRPLIVGNWKMNGTEPEASSLADALILLVPADDRGVDVALAPPFTSLRTVGDRIRGTRLDLAAQNLHRATHGAFTGEISAPMLAALGVRYAIVGHSERRRLFGESNEEVAHKAVAARTAGLVPILCVGEEETQRMEGKTLPVIEAQMKAAFAALKNVDGDGLVIAYEPVWAIGTGRTASPGQIEEVHGAIRGFLAAAAGPGPAAQVRILYGGSVTGDNAQTLLRSADVDGALVGGASLVAESFARIVAAAVRP